MSSSIQKLIGIAERRRRAEQQSDLRVRVDTKLLEELKLFLSDRGWELSATVRVLVEALLEHNPGVLAVIESSHRAKERTRKGPSLSKREIDGIYDMLDAEE